MNVRWLLDLLGDLGEVAQVPVRRVLREWHARRAARRLVDERIAAFKALPPEEQLGYIHPASPTKPPGWTLEKYRATVRRRDAAH